MVFSNPEEVRAAYDAGAVDMHARVEVRMNGKRVQTSVGRLLLWEVIPKGESFILRHIMVSSEDRAKEILAALKGGEAFSDLVTNYSEAFDKAYNGNIGLLEKDEFQDIFQVDDAVAKAVYSLKQGEVTPIIRSGGKYHIFKVVEVREEIPFDMINKVLNKKGLRELEALVPPQVLHGLLDVCLLSPHFDTVPSVFCRVRHQSRVYPVAHLATPCTPGSPVACFGCDERGDDKNGDLWDSQGDKHCSA